MHGYGTMDSSSRSDYSGAPPSYHTHQGGSRPPSYHSHEGDTYPPNYRYYSDQEEQVRYCRREHQEPRYRSQETESLLQRPPQYSGTVGAKLQEQRSLNKQLIWAAVIQLVVIITLLVFVSIPQKAPLCVPPPPPPARVNRKWFGKPPFCGGYRCPKGSKVIMTSKFPHLGKYGGCGTESETHLDTRLQSCLAEWNTVCWSGRSILCESAVNPKNPKAFPG